MILEITKDNKTYQAYKEIGITRNIIIEIFELITFKSPFGYNVTSHKYITSKGTDFSFNNTCENDIKLIEKTQELIKEVLK